MSENKAMTLPLCKRETQKGKKTASLGISLSTLLVHCFYRQTRRTHTQNKQTQLNEKKMCLKGYKDILYK